MSPSMKFPFFDLTRQYRDLKSDMMPSIEQILDRQSLIMGDATLQFEREIAEWIGVKHAITCASGTDALVLPLKAFGIGPGDEVITTAYSFFASTGSILFCGAKPVFADIEPGTYNIDVRQIEKLVTSRTRAILPVHLYGQCADMDEIMQVAQRHNLMVLEDAAQSIGAKLNGKPAGGIGHVGAMSFYPTKNLGGAGEGGLMTTNDDQLADKLRLIRVHGMRVRYTHELLGTNSRLDALQCAYLRVKLPHLNSWTQRRSEISRRYTKELAPLVSRGLILPKVDENKEHVWNQYIVRVPKRDGVRSQLTQKGIPTEVYYPFTIPHQAPLRGICSENGWPVAEEAARGSLALPIFPELHNSEQTDVIEALSAVLG